MEPSNIWVCNYHYESGHREYVTKIGHFIAKVELAEHPGKSNHWRYTIKNPNGLFATGHRFPWDEKRAMNFVILFIAMRAISNVLVGDEKALYNEDGLDRV